MGKCCWYVISPSGRAGALHARCDHQHDVDTLNEVAPFVSPWYNLYVSGGEAGRKTRHRSAMDPRAEVAGPEGARLLNGDGILCGMLLLQADRLDAPAQAWGRRLLVRLHTLWQKHHCEVSGSQLEPKHRPCPDTRA